jgi:hypothetical protein
MKNIPYVKQYNEDGTIANPIKGSYESKLPNRSQRRNNKQPRFVGNGKNHHMTITGRFRYDRRIQIIGKKRIEHYVLQS